MFTMQLQFLHRPKLHQRRCDRSRPSIVSSRSDATRTTELSSEKHWQRHWWPLMPLDMLDASQPTPIRILGQDLVIWRSQSDHWSVLSDKCPHRFAPLSQGRLSEDGSNLVCSYHGWKFEGYNGRCVDIPQLTDGKAKVSALTSPRACVASFPTSVYRGMLWAWLDSGIDAEAEAALSGGPQLPQPYSSLDGSNNWIWNTIPNDARSSLEQVIIVALAQSPRCSYQR